MALLLVGGKVNQTRITACLAYGPKSRLEHTEGKGGNRHRRRRRRRRRQRRRGREEVVVMVVVAEDDYDERGRQPEIISP
ncbi:hypothetical protein M0802_001247 [Mischocyttarus mexicanus]|nr:hypothetical protein M0802_001247 [Mischocyttarus mexicanus]